MTIAECMAIAADLRARPALAPLGDWYVTQAKRMQQGLPMERRPPAELSVSALLRAKPEPPRIEPDPDADEPGCNSDWSA